jgi:hypothetical protein
MPHEFYEEPPRLDVINRLVEGARDGMVEALHGEPFSAAEAVSAAMTLTASIAEIMLAMSTPDGYGYNLNQILKGIKALEARVNPSPGVMQ